VKRSHLISLVNLMQSVVDCSKIVAIAGNNKVLIVKL